MTIRVFFEALVELVSDLKVNVESKVAWKSSPKETASLIQVAQLIGLLS